MLAGLVIALAAPCSRAAEGLSPEALLPAHDGRDAYAPAVGFGNNVFLVAWQSGRLGPGDIREGLNFTGDLVACRVNGSGKVLDEKPLVVSAAGDLQERPRIASDGRNFLVVWQDLRPSAPPTGSGQAGSGQAAGKDYDVYAARVTPDGKVLDPDGILVCGGKGNQANPRAAWDGKAFVVVWQDFRNGSFYEVYGGRVSPEGKTLDPDGVKLVAGDGVKHQRYTPAVASAGEGKSFVAWAGGHGRNADAGGVFFADGKPAESVAYKDVDARGHGPGGPANPVSLAASPAGYLAAWRTSAPISRGDTGGKSTAAVLGTDGTIKKRLFLAGKEHRTHETDVAWDGASFVGVWYEFMTSGRGATARPYFAVRAARLSPEGEPVGEPLAVAGSQPAPACYAAVASDGKGLSLICYEQHPKDAETPIKIGFRMLSAK
jgi:hypothetical protein